MTPEKRRELFERVVGRAAKMGYPFESSPAFLAHVDDWIQGKITPPELRRQYVLFLKQRAAGAHEQAGLEVQGSSGSDK
ncbi:hypothetical protein REJC140_03517 [Pseudorhizobium endolithicum]|uniref:Antitoxin VbhA domain-containing protein n=1 Tax=Pseudorhizobium endolithicum TaxID=1191678 RepID=A0ABM8PLD0_9HYPH|nr:hypothetical protein REJC140_03517 [Pseudorhizobium endolithicum]